jgi:hypothetical protein
MQCWLPEAAYARRAGVSAQRLARLRKETVAVGCWQRAFGTYLWNIQAMDLVKKLAARKRTSPPQKAAAAETAAPANDTPRRVTLRSLWRREERLYRAQDAQGNWLLVRTERLHPLGSTVSVFQGAAGGWTESA